MSEADQIRTDILAYLAQHEQKELVYLSTCGSVDDGKSTLLGRLLCDTGSVPDDQISAARAETQRRGNVDGDLDYSLLFDGLISEREQGITIDVAYRHFATPKRKFIVADTPGHEQYTRNMATGASTADLSLVLVDARAGMLAQTRRHSLIASLFGIKHVVVAVNKMDLVGFDPDVFARIKAEFWDYAVKLNIPDVHFIPLSALHGDNVIERSARMPWYDGHPLLSLLETVQIAADRNFADFRFPVQWVNRPHRDFRGFAGTVVSGVVRVGDPIMALPSGKRSRVRSIVTFEGTIPEAFPPQAVTLTLEDEIDVGRGDVLVRPDNVAHVARSFEAMMVWMDERPLTPGRQYLLKLATTEVPVEAKDVRYRLDVESLNRADARALAMNEIGRVALTSLRPLAFDPYAKNRAMGAFIVIDRMTNATAGAGMILDRTAEQERTADLGEGFVVWFTGLSGAGKSTLSEGLAAALRERGVRVEVLDGDEVRTHLSDGRDTNVHRLGFVAKLIARVGGCAITTAISPSRAVRDEQRAQIPRFVEVYCEADVAALAAPTGEPPNGGNADYEPPVSPEVVCRPHREDVQESLSRILAKLEALGYLG